MAVNAWSHSALDSFETCPYRHALTKVDKVVIEPQTREMAWGNKVHKALELRVKDGTPLETGMEQWEPVARSFIAKRAHGHTVTAEQKLALGKDLRPVGYFAKENGENIVWVRGQADITSERRSSAIIGDYKTGKPRENSDQMKLMAVLNFALKPYLENITTAFIWLKFPELPPTVEHFTRGDVPAIWDNFNERVKRLDHALAERKFPKKPSGLCREWCPVPPGKGPNCCEHRTG